MKRKIKDPEEPQECDKCEGEGTITCPVCYPNHSPNSYEDRDEGCCHECNCNDCNQEGVIDCDKCEGTGETPGRDGNMEEED